MAGGSRAPPAVAERVVSQGFENERHEVVMNDVTVDGHPNLEPERVVTRRVLLTFRPRPLDDRELHDATVRIGGRGMRGRSPHSSGRGRRSSSTRRVGPESDREP